MKALPSHGWKSLGAALLLAGCSTQAAVRSQHEARSIAPLAEGAREGHLVAAVLGHPRAIEYSVNGVRIEPEVAIAWWEDARFELPLQPGTYRLEATYRVRGFAPGKFLARIETPDPVEVHAGATTYVLADLAKDWRGVPAQEVTTFRVVDAATFTRLTTAAANAEKSGVAVTSAAATSAATAAASPVDDTGSSAAAGAAETQSTAATAGTVTVIRGTPEGVTSTTEVPPTGGEAAESIIIHGDAVVPPGGQPAVEASATAPAPSSATATTVPEASSTVPGASSAAPQSDALATGTAAGTIAVGSSSGEATPKRDIVEPVGPEAQGLPSAADPPSQVLLEPGSSAPATIAMRLDSQPSGAKVLVDEREVGKTPLELRIDPTVDHVIRFERDGCGDHVRFISAAGWEKGRSTKLSVQLECP